MQTTSIQALLFDVGGVILRTEDPAPREALALWSRKARWLHLRVREKGKMQVALSFPIPILMGKWFFTLFGGVIPGLRDQPGVVESMPEMLDALGRSREPLIVEVNDEDTEVRIYLI